MLVCENHRDKAWPDCGCGAPGMPLSDKELELLGMLDRCGLGYVSTAAGEKARASLIEKGLAQPFGSDGFIASTRLLEMNAANA